MLENTRFEAGDVRDAPALAAELAALCDAYVLDGWSCQLLTAKTDGWPGAERDKRFGGPAWMPKLAFQHGIDTKSALDQCQAKPTSPKAPRVRSTSAQTCRRGAGRRCR